MDPIFVATDLSARSDRAVARAGRLAARLGRPLRIFAALADGALDAAQTLTRLDELEAELGARAARASREHGIEASGAAEAGTPVDLVPRAAREARAHLVVMGSHANRGMAELVSTPTLARVLRALDVPCLVAAGPPERDWRRVAVGVDLSPASLAALRLAAELAPAAELMPCHAYAPPHAGSAFAAIPEAVTAADMAERATEVLASIPEGLRARTAEPVLRAGSPEGVLGAYAREISADLIAVGRHARGGLARMLLGETSTELMLSAGCDVLVAPPPG